MDVIKDRLVPGAVIGNLLTTSPSAGLLLMVCYIHPTHFSENFHFKQKEKHLVAAVQAFRAVHEIQRGKGRGKGHKM